MAGLTKNIVSHASLTALGVVTQFMLVVFLSHKLDPSQYSKFIFAVAAIAVFEICSDFGMRIIAIKGMVAAPDRFDIVRNSYFIKMANAIVIFSVLPIFQINMLSVSELVMCVLVSFFQPSSDPFLWRERAAQRLFVDAYVVFFNRLFISIGIISCSFFFANALVILVVWLLVDIIRTFLEVMYYTNFKQLKLVFPRIREFKTTYVLIVPIGISLVLTSLFQRFGVFAVDQFGTEHDIAVFGTAFTLVSSAAFVSTSIVQAYFPRITKSFVTSNYDGLYKDHKNMMLYLSMIVLLIVLASILFGRQIVVLVYPSYLHDSSEIMLILFPALYISSISFAYKYTLNIVGRNWFDSFAVMGGLVVFTMVIVVSRDIFNASIVASIGWSVSELFVMVFRSIVLMRNVKYIFKSMIVFVSTYLFLNAVVYILYLSTFGKI